MVRKIIDGRAYDTDTATEVGSRDNGLEWADLAHECETLYRKRTGEYFVHGEGGPRTRYARRGEVGWSGGEAITPVSYDEARGWAEGCLDAGAYEREFGEASEGDSEVVLSVRVTGEARSRLDRYARATGRTKGGVVTRLLDRALPCVEQPYRTMPTLDPGRWDAGQVRDAANCVLYMALAEASYALGDGQALSEGAEGLRRAAMDELRRRGELA